MKNNNEMTLPTMTTMNNTAKTGIKALVGALGLYSLLLAPLTVSAQAPQETAATTAQKATQKENTQREKLLGLWNLQGLSKNLDDEPVPSRNRWSFTDDGNFVTQDTGVATQKGQFRIKEGLLETNELGPGRWSRYEIIRLDDEAMVLHSRQAPLFFHFNRVEQLTFDSSKYYATDTFIRITIAAACSKLLGGNDEIVMKMAFADRLKEQGITDYDEKKYQASSVYYKNNQDFMLNQKDKLTEKIMACMSQRQEKAAQQGPTIAQ